MSRAQILSTTAIALCVLSVVASPGRSTAADAAAAPDASAKPADVGEVVVTARGRAEKLIQAPVSVQAFSDTVLSQDKITGLASLQYEAGFTFNSQGASFFGGGREFPTLVFRGMTSNYGEGQADSGALFVDGIYISGGAASVTLADASQVEVLKGPQNVYFGKNTFGGAVNLITANPTEDYHGSLSAGYSDKGSYDDVAMIEGAVIPGLLTAKLTGELLHQGAQYRALDGGPLGEQDTKGITAVLYATPTPGVWLRTRIHYSEDNDSEAADGFISGGTYGTSCPGMINPYFCNGIPSLGQLSAKSVLSGTAIPSALLTAVQNNDFYGSPGILISKVPHEDHAGLVRDNLQASLQGGVDLPYGAKFLFNTGYNQQASLNISSSDHTPENVFTSALPFITRDFQADGRIVTDSSKPYRFVAGIFYFRSIYQLDYEGYYYGLFDDSGPTNEKDETEAAYGSAEYDIKSYLTLTGEVRYQRDTISDASIEGYPTILTAPVEKSYNHALPRFILKYHPTPETNVYLSYSEGVQPPQLQTSYIEGDSYTKAAIAAVSAGGGDYTADPKVRVWEIGLKQSLFENRLFFSVDYYNQFWDNALVDNFLFNDPANHCSTLPTVGVSTLCPYPGGGAGVFTVSQNHIQGIEFEGTGKITDKWTAHMVFNWTDAIRKSYDDQSWPEAFTDGVVPNQDGKRIDLVPEFQGSWDSTYRDHLAGPYDWYVHGVVTYTGPTYVEATNIAKLNGYARVNLFAGITKGNLKLEAFVTNLFNDKNWDYAVRFPDPAFFFSEAHQGVIAGAPNPRDFGFKVSAKF
jgi:iron complex outermembrane receptor protein